MYAREDWLRVLAFARLAGRLKRLRRKGWVDRGVVDPESVADHSFRLALLAWIVGQQLPGLDPARMALLALVHDLPEALAGDRTPFDTALDAGAERSELFRRSPVYTPEEAKAKAEAERAALAQMVAALPKPVAEGLQALWEEYQREASEEARLVRQLDKLETALQALEYQAEQSDIVIDSFLLDVAERVHHPSLREGVAVLIETWRGEAGNR